MKNYYLLLLFFLLLNSCNTAYYTTLRKHHVKNKKYFSVKDTIRLSHVILCNANAYGFRGEKNYLPINEDSTMAYFTKALAKTNLNVKVADPLQFSCHSFMKKGQDYWQPLKSDIVQQLAKENISQYKLIPLIGHFTRDYDAVSFTLSAGAPISQLNRSTTLSITIYILEDNNIVYSKSMFVRTKITPIEIDMQGNVLNYKSGKPYVSTLEQKHWDKLIEKTMKDFIKRMKDEEDK